MEHETVLDLLKRISLKHIDSRINELKNQFIEMGQLKSEFDIEKFTIRKEGHFIAHNFHFLMRQYSLALWESRRMLLDKEEKTRELGELKECDEYKLPNGKYTDIEIKRVENEIDRLDVSLANKLNMVEYFEKCRAKLIQINGGEAPTNRQYQEEEPAYWEWFVKKKILQQAKQAQTGIQEGIWELIDHIEAAPLLNDAYRAVLESYDLEKIEQEIKVQKMLGG